MALASMFVYLCAGLGCPLARHVVALHFSLRLVFQPTYVSMTDVSFDPHCKL
jgi:hypothetical protein